jgi:NodT family efflux transporter outer membrane factor (OMF) lipoprotein
MPGKWHAPSTTQQALMAEESAQLEQWWTEFDDPILNSLITRAVTSNLDVQSATERIREARASIGIASANLWPSANANGSYSYSGTGRSKSVDLWRAGLDAAWELDVFGGVRRSVEAANADFEASIEDRRDVLVTLLGELATDYIALRGQQQQIAIAHENLEVQIRNAQLTRDKKRLGTGTELDVVQSDSQVTTTRAALASFEASEQQAIYAISILLGLPPDALQEELKPSGEIPQPPTLVSVGLPSDLLRRRPDIRRSERQLAAATADIGVAVADWFPKFSLTGDLNLNATHFAGLGNWANRSWTFGPSVTWPIFDPGRIASNVEVQNARQAESLLSYRHTVLTALQEVQNAMTSYTHDRERRDALAQSVELNQRAVQLATQRYQQGITDFLIVLDAERTLFASQDALVQTDRDIATDVVALYKALGGGWETTESSATTAPSIAADQN